MNDAASPWPERERTQYLLFGAGAALLVPVALALAAPLELGGTAVVGAATAASALLMYGLLGWAGDRVAGDGRDPDAS